MKSIARFKKHVLRDVIIATALVAASLVMTSVASEQGYTATSGPFETDIPNLEYSKTVTWTPFLDGAGLDQRFELRNTSSVDTITFQYRVSYEDPIMTMTLPPNRSTVVSKSWIWNYDEDEAPPFEDSTIEFFPDSGGGSSRAAVEKNMQKIARNCRALQKLIGTAKMKQKAKKLSKSLSEVRKDAAVHYPLIKLKNLERAETLAEKLAKKNQPRGTQLKSINKITTIVEKVIGGSL